MSLLTRIKCWLYQFKRVQCGSCTRKMYEANAAQCGWWYETLAVYRDGQLSITSEQWICLVCRWSRKDKLLN